jgi:uroporphyrinogen decarboxylase
LESGRGDLEKGMTSKKDRIQAAIAGELADRPPVALWRHFPVDDQDPRRLADATLDFQQRFDFDFIKVTPSSSQFLRDWGVRDEWKGNPEGTREYIKRVIQSPSDWRELPILEPHAGEMGSQLECLRIIREQVGESVPVIQTIFNPLAQAKNLAGADLLIEHLHRDPEAVLAGIETITRTTMKFVETVLQLGVAGIFYAVQHASYRFFDHEGFQKFVEPFDLRILEIVSDAWLNVLHLHGRDLIFEVAERYPVQIVNWHDRETGPNLSEGQSRLTSAVCGGLRQWDTMVLGDPEQVRREAMDASEQTHGGRGLILGTGCVVPVTAPYGNLRAARVALTAHSHK